MVNRRKKHTILGGVKVSSQQLSEWGSSGGRPTKYSNNAERQRAKRLRKKQEKLGLEAQLRDYKSYEAKSGGKNPSGSLNLICNACASKFIGSELHLGQQCSNCLGNYHGNYQGSGNLVREEKIIKRAGNSRERVKRFRGRVQ